MIFARFEMRCDSHELTCEHCETAIPISEPFTQYVVQKDKINFCSSCADAWESLLRCQANGGPISMAEK